MVMSSWYPTRLDAFLGNFVERFVDLLVTDYDVSVLHTQSDDSISKIEVIEDRSKGFYEVIVYYPRGKNPLSQWWNRRRALSKGMRLIEDVDLIYGHIFINKISQFVRAKFHYHCPLIVHEHASYHFKESKYRLNKIQRQNLRNFSMYVKKIVAVSDILRNEMKTTFPTTKIAVIPNVINEQVFLQKINTLAKIEKFIHISTLDKKTKNPKMLFEGFALAVQNLSANSTLTVVSDKEKLDWVNWVRENRMTDRIFFKGPLEINEIALELQQHDCLLQTSDLESFGIVMAEAWLVGLPIISTSVGIAHELPDFLGLQIKKDNSIDLAEKLFEIQNAEKKYDSTEIRTHALQYSAENVLKNLKELFETYFDQA